MAMGTPGVRQVRRQTTFHFEKFAKQLRTEAEQLDEVVRLMKVMRVDVLEVRYAPGAWNSLGWTISKYVKDAANKLEKIRKQREVKSQKNDS
jgi:hypothetical protein